MPWISVTFFLAEPPEPLSSLPPQAGRPAATTSAAATARYLLTCTDPPRMGVFSWGLAVFAVAAAQLVDDHRDDQDGPDRDRQPEAPPAEEDHAVLGNYR